MIFKYAFFKFTWAIRQLGNLDTGRRSRRSPGKPEQSAPVITERTHPAYAQTNFTTGLRGYYSGSPPSFCRVSAPVLMPSPRGSFTCCTPASQ